MAKGCSKQGCMGVASRRHCWIHAALNVERAIHHGTCVGRTAPCFNLVPDRWHWTTLPRSSMDLNSICDQTLINRWRDHRIATSCQWCIAERQWTQAALMHRVALVFRPMNRHRNGCKDFSPTHLMSLDCQCFSSSNQFASHTQVYVLRKNQQQPADLSSSERIRTAHYNCGSTCHLIYICLKKNL